MACLIDSVQASALASAFASLIANLHNHLIISLLKAPQEIGQCIYFTNSSPRPEKPVLYRAIALSTTIMRTNLQMWRLRITVTSSIINLHNNKKNLTNKCNFRVVNIKIWQNLPDDTLKTCLLLSGILKKNFSLPKKL